MLHGIFRPSRRAWAAVLCTAALVVSSACTPDTEPDPAPEQPAAESPPASEGAPATIEPKPVPASVRVTRVIGRLKAKDRDVLENKVGKVVSAYFDDAFLGGEYPRSAFRDSFGTFSRGAASKAVKQRDLLTNQELGPTTVAVTPRRQSAYLSVLAPHKVAAGVTARVDLRYLVDRADEPDMSVTVKGRLMLTRKKSGGWQIFGYDLSRSASPIEEES